MMGSESIAKELEESRNALARLNNSKYRQNVVVKETIEKLTEQRYQSLSTIC